MNNTELINTFSAYCNDLIRNNRPVLADGAKGLSKIKHLQKLTSLVPKLQSEMTDKANQLLTDFEGDVSNIKEEFAEIATAKLKAFVNG